MYSVPSAVDKCRVKFSDCTCPEFNMTPPVYLNEGLKSALKDPNEQEFWYTNTRLKHFMADISKNAKCSKICTAHCLCATGIQRISDTVFGFRHILPMSGQKSESFVLSYSLYCLTAQKNIHER